MNEIGDEFISFFYSSEFVSDESVFPDDLDETFKKGNLM